MAVVCFVVGASNILIVVIGAFQSILHGAFVALFMESFGIGQPSAGSEIGSALD
jgi:hypothetical protein